MWRTLKMSKHQSFLAFTFNKRHYSHARYPCLFCFDLINVLNTRWWDDTEPCLGTLSGSRFDHCALSRKCQWQYYLVIALSTWRSTVGSCQYWYSTSQECHIAGVKRDLKHTLNFYICCHCRKITKSMTLESIQPLAFNNLSNLSQM